MSTQRTLASSFFHIICALALVMVGFAHKPPVHVPADVQFAAYILPDGKLPTLCVNEDPSKPAKPSLGSPACEACRLAASVLLPERLRYSTPAQVFVAVRVTEERQFLIKPSPRDPGSRPRAPPVSVMIS